MAKQKTNLALVAPSKLTEINADIEALNFAARKLRAADSELLKEDIALQGTRGMVPTRNDALINAAIELLDGPSGDAPKKSMAARIHEVTAERQKIAKALEIADGRMIRLMFDRAIEKRKLMADAWAELQRQRCLAVVNLQSLNRRAQAMLATVADPHGHAEMPAAFAQVSPAKFLLGVGTLRAGEAHEFLTLNIKTGVVTKGDLDKAMAATSGESSE